MGCREQGNMSKNDWGNREQKNVCRGNKGTVSLLSGNWEHYKRLIKIKFLHRKARLNLIFAKFVNWYSKILLRFVFMTSALCPRRLPAFFLEIMN